MLSCHAQALDICSTTENVLLGAEEKYSSTGIIAKNRLLVVFYSNIYFKSLETTYDMQQKDNPPVFTTSIYNAHISVRQNLKQTKQPKGVWNELTEMYVCEWERLCLEIWLTERNDDIL